MSDEIPRKGQLTPSHRAPVSRIRPTPQGEPLARWFWVPEWDLPPGEVHEALTLPFPACQLVIEADGVRVHGPVSRVWRRDLVGRGWAVGALLTPGAAHALVGEVTQLLDSDVEAKGASPLHAAVTVVMDSGDPKTERHAEAVRLLEQWLIDRVGAAVAADPEAEDARRLVALADGDPDLLRVDDISQRLTMSVRSMQRLARSHVGMSPAAMIRRRRLQEAAERVRGQPGADLASIAMDLGYSDHAHLTREFARILGFTPTAYRRRG